MTLAPAEEQFTGEVPYGPFGDPARYYAEPVGHQRSLPRNSKIEELEKRVREILQRFDPDLQKRVERTFRQWNHALRDQLRIEMALRLTVGDASQAVPVRVEAGLPIPFANIIGPLESKLWLLLHLPRLESTASGLVLLGQEYEAFRELDTRATDHASLGEIRNVSVFVETVVGALRQLELLKKLSAINEDVLGAYFFKEPAIRLYWMVIGLMSAILRVPVEALTIVVAAHELAHAYSHLGRDIDGERWSRDSFARADMGIVEGLAQFYTEVICKKLESRLPGASGAYAELLKHQSGPYVVHKTWAQETASAGEIVRVSMIQCRSTGVVGYGEFAEVLERHRVQLKHRHHSEGAP